MSSSADSAPIRARAVSVTDDALIVRLTDGRTVTVPVARYPRLAHATPEERSEHSIIGGGEGIRWPALDEDISVAGLIEGRPSGESERSLRKWLGQREHTGRG